MPQPEVRRSAKCWRRSGLLAAALTLALAGSAGAETLLRVGKAVPEAFSFVPLDVGIAHGIFAKHGLRIDAVGFAGSAKLHQALAADSIDLGLGSGPELAFVAKGAPVEGIAAMMGAPGLLSIVVN